MRFICTVESFKYVRQGFIGNSRSIICFGNHKLSIFISRGAELNPTFSFCKLYTVRKDLKLAALRPKHLIQKITDAVAEKGFKTKYALDYSLRQALADGSIVRIGWNQYVFVNEKALYKYKYSEDALEIASVLSSEYEGIRFRIFEMRQLNGFQNHLIAHNTIFVYVENDLIDYAFDTLRTIYA